MNILDLVHKLYPFDYSVTGAGNDAAAQVLAELLPFEVLSYDSGREINGWLIPPACSVECARVTKNGAVVIDCTSRPMGVPAQSDSFVGRVSLEELKRHLFSDATDAAATPYHWMRLYRPREPVWGFCVPRRSVDALAPGDYDVELVTRKTPGKMRVLVHALPGESPDTVLFNAHNCHPYQANDDISGIAVGIALMQRLAKLPRRRLTYALMVAPELFGPVFWLDGLAEGECARLKATVMLKSVGNDAPLRLQQSFTGTAPIDLAAHQVFRKRFGEYESGEFRAIYGNDETVFEAPPFAIPSISLTRWPFAGYHTDQDTPERMLESRLQDAVDTAYDICRAMEMDLKLTTTARGLVCLSSHGLYKSVPDMGPGGVDYSSLGGRWNRLMNLLPRLLDGNTGLLQIAARFELPIDEVYEYAMKWVAARLAADAEQR